MGATHVEKATMDEHGQTERLHAAGSSYSVTGADEAEPEVCSILDPDCEACQ